MNASIEKRKQHTSSPELLYMPGIVFLLLFLRLFCLEVNLVRGISMYPTLIDGEKILLDTWSYRLHPVQRGDIVVFAAPPQPQLFYVKRVIGLPGDRITVANTRIVVNSVTLSEPYVLPSLQGNPNPIKTEQFTVPQDAFFVLGDDRLYSDDSRDWGFVPRANIVGKVTVILTPFAPNTGYVKDESAVYAGV